MSACVSKSLELLFDYLGFFVDVVIVVATYRLIDNIFLMIFIFLALFCLYQFEISHVPLLLIVVVSCLSDQPNDLCSSHSTHFQSRSASSIWKVEFLS